MSDREKLIQEFSQSEEERWASLVGGGESTEETPVVERLHSVKERASRDEHKKTRAVQQSTASNKKPTSASASQPNAPAGPRQRTLFDRAPGSASAAASSSQQVDIEAYLQRLKSTQDNEEDAPDIDISKFMQDDDDDDQQDDGDTNFSASSYLAALMATSESKPVAAQSITAPPDQPLMFESEERMVVPLQDEALTVVKPSAKSKAEQAPKPRQVAASSESNYLKKEMSTAPLEVKSEYNGSTAATVKREEETDVPVASGAAYVPPEAAVYWIDAKEQDHTHRVDPGSVFLFGKYVVDGGGASAKTFHSCCLRVANLMRCVMFLPKGDPTDAVQEVRQLCIQLGIPSFRMKVVDRYYAFEEPNIPREKRKWVKLRFPARYPPFPTNRGQWQHIEASVGNNRSLLELFLLKRRFSGPSYLKITEWLPVAEAEKISHCRYEFRVLDPKHVTPVDGGVPPPLVAVSLQLHTQLDAGGSHNEVHCVSMIVCKSVAADGSARAAPITQQLVGVRQFSPSTPLPLDLERYCVGRGLPPVKRFVSELQLLQWTASMLHEIDADLMVGHNFLSYTLDVLLHRYAALRVYNWSTLGRLDVRQFPKLQSGAGGTQESTFQERDVCVGRLVVDTYTLAREYHKSSNYKLVALAQQLKLSGIFGEVKDDFVDAIPQLDAASMSTNATVFDVAARSVNNSVLALALANQLDVVPLTKRLTTLAGNLWSRTLAGSRAERIEYLLLHAFHELKFVTPDKKSFEAIQKQKRAENEAEDGVEGADDAPVAARSARSKAKYKGGMVLEPKTGLYTDYILLLDFNSLYPSLIQEFNICFTTVKRAGGCTVFDEGEDPHGPSKVPPPESLICAACIGAGAPPPCAHKCVLPKVIKGLVDSRREVKRLMKTERDQANLAQLEIRQKALKLTANSMYGCLGFEYSRFYAQSLAELVTEQGRAALGKAVETVPLVNPNFSVIYGDTDSVMIKTGVKDDLALVRDMAKEITKTINKPYRCLEIDIDGVFRSILLHKKKKYASVHVVDWAGEGKVLKREVKGLDMVRRDWCPLSQRCCDELLARILAPDTNGGGTEEVLDFIARYMKTVSDKVRAGDVLLDDFVVAKSLTKEPETYKGTSFPHAAVALRMRERKEQVRVGDLIPYVICREDTPAASLSSKAFHPEEVKKGGKLIDTEWYIATQLYPPVLRICEHIQGFTATQLGEAMGVTVHTAMSTAQGGAGMDSGRARDVENFANMFKSPVLEECYPEAQRVEVACTRCHTMTPIQPHAEIQAIHDALQPNEDVQRPFPIYCCYKCKAPQHPAYVANCVALLLRKHFVAFYEQGGTPAAVRTLRTNMTYLRALFDVPHIPGCSRKIIRLHRQYALRCLSIQGSLHTIAQNNADLEAEDPVYSLISLQYHRVAHMFIKLESIFDGLPAPTLRK